MINHMQFLRVFTVLFIMGVVTGWVGVSLAADDPKAEAYGVAIKGYDPIAYFKLGKATKGDRKISLVWNEAVWHFASKEHRDLFAADPLKYAPQHSGY